MSDYLWLILLGLLCLANAWVSRRVIRCDFYSRQQKWAQCLLVWLLPIIGASLVGAFLRSQYGWQPDDTRAYPEFDEKMSITMLSEIRHQEGMDVHPGD